MMKSYDPIGHWSVNKRFFVKLIFKMNFSVQIVKFLQHIP